MTQDQDHTHFPRLPSTKPPLSIHYVWPQNKISLTYCALAVAFEMAYSRTLLTIFIVNCAALSLGSSDNQGNGRRISHVHVGCHAQVHCTSLGWWSKVKVQTCTCTRNAPNNKRLGQQNRMRLTTNMRLYAICA